MQDLKVTLVQTELNWIDRIANYDRIERLIGSISHDTDLIVLPEAFTTGFHMSPDENTEDFSVGETISRMKQWAKGRAICGSFFVKDNGHFYNRMLFVEPDGNFSVYDKRHLFRMAGENEVYTGGHKKTLVNYRGWKIALFVCYDLRFPVWSRNNVGYDLAIYVANWPAARKNAWRTLLRARAIENQCYVVGVNRVGEDGNGIVYEGDSAAIDPKGEDIVELPVNQQEIVTASLSLEELNFFREKFPVARDADDFTINL